VLVFRDRLPFADYHTFDLLDRSGLRPFPKVRKIAFKSNDIICIPAIPPTEERLSLKRKSIKGQFTMGKLYGYSKIFYGDYATFSGNMHAGMKHGFGVLDIYSDHLKPIFGDTESRYVGEWALDMKHGKGEMSWANGSRYSGYYRQGQRDKVTGTMYFKEGEIYSGVWVDDMMHG
jgi:hypothetical protein